MAREVVALTVMGIDQHENGIVAVSRVLMEAQMQVNYLGVCQTPDSVVDRAIGSQADVIGISCHSWEYLALVPQLIEKLRSAGSDIQVIIGGSVITSEDAKKMADAGVAAVFTSSTDTLAIVECVRKLAAEKKAASPSWTR